MPKKLRVSLKRFHALEVTRIGMGNQKLVYVLVANKRFSYPFAKSAIAYIGTTRKGFERVASSAAGRAEGIFSERPGIQTVTARIVTCAPRKHVASWKKLERALLQAFKHEYGAVPVFNSQGKGMRETDEYEYFSREAVRKCILALG
jgi:hypothetical protein